MCFLRSIVSMLSDFVGLISWFGALCGIQHKILWWVERNAVFADCVRLRIINFWWAMHSESSYSWFLAVQLPFLFLHTASLNCSMSVVKEVSRSISVFFVNRCNDKFNLTISGVPGFIIKPLQSSHCCCL
jgi:hypothetical protein